jgi:hypothetical protein
MDAQLQALDAVLRDELTLVRALVERLPYKIALIRKNLVDQLGRLSEAELVDQQRLAVLEQARELALAELCEIMGVPPTSRLIELSSSLPVVWRQRFDDLGLQLKDAVKVLHEGHETCKVMLQAAFETLELTMGLVADRVQEPRVRVYGSAPRDPEPTPRSSVLLDWRA